MRQTFYFLIAIPIALSACTDSSTKSTLSAATDSKRNEAVEMAQAPDICAERQTQGEKTACLYERFNYESALCGKLEQLVKKEGLMPKLEKDFYSPIGSKALEILLIGPLREDADVRYFMTHRAYFEIDVDFHNRTPGSVYFAQLGLYCAQTTKRIGELESLGPSDLAWDARKKWLDHYLKIIRWPWNEMDGPEKTFFVEFDRLKKIYNRPEDRKRLYEWTKKAERFFFEAAERGNIDGYAGKSKQQHLDTLREWMEQLRRDLDAVSIRPEPGRS